jgi:hypothetical protein
LKPVQNKTLKAAGLRATLPDLPMILAWMINFENHSSQTKQDKLNRFASQKGLFSSPPLFNLFSLRLCGQECPRSNCVRCVIKFLRRAFDKLLASFVPKPLQSTYQFNFSSGVLCCEK